MSHDPIAPADWDSRHFGFPVARVTAGPLPDALALAAARGFRLVYWSGGATDIVPADVLGRFGGLLADRKVTFRRPLSPADELPPFPAPGTWVSEVPPGPASAELVGLAIESGGHSRYRVDPNFPREAFESMYRTWIDRSTRREIADTVLAAHRAGAADDPLGLVTVAVEGGVGRVGLIAVDSRARGRGLGVSLMRAAHAHMAARGCTAALVTTQLDNDAACALYARCGYREDAVSRVYHFWPQAG